MDGPARPVQDVRRSAPRPDPVSASEVTDAVALLLIEAAIDHERVGHRLLADLLRQHAAEVLRPSTADGSPGGPPATDAPRAPRAVDVRDGGGPRTRTRTRTR